MDIAHFKDGRIRLLYVFLNAQRHMGGWAADLQRGAIPHDRVDEARK